MLTLKELEKDEKILLKIEAVKLSPENFPAGLSAAAAKVLRLREKEILSLRFYNGKTQMEVASRLGISQAQVSRLEKGAIAAMRKSVSVS